MGYRLNYTRGNTVFMSGARVETPREAADDAESYLRQGATRVEIVAESEQEVRSTPDAAA